MKITEIYLQDFQSRQARLQHTRYSPLGHLKLPKPGRAHGRDSRLYRRPGDRSDDAGGVAGGHTEERTGTPGDDAPGAAVCAK